MPNPVDHGANQAYDDLARVNTVGCGIWSQTFTIAGGADIDF